MRMRRAGKRRHYVSLQHKTANRDASGGFTDSWTTYAQVYTELTPVAASEGQRIGETEMVTAFEAPIDYRSDVVAGDRLLFGSRILNISGFINEEERDKTLILTCQEIANG